MSAADPASHRSHGGAVIRFVKMHGLGNDFMVVDRRDQVFAAHPDEIRRLADRRTGIGFDQLLTLDEPQEGADIAWRIYNADGGEVRQCGNGARCIARLIHDQLGCPDRAIVLDGRGNRLTARVHETGRVSVDMGVPDFRPASLPFEATSEAQVYTIQANGEEVRFGAVSVGNPHIVLPVNDVADARVSELGQLLERHTAFPQGTNVGFVQIVDRKRLNLRIHERGTGETRACGSGACAAAAVTRVWGETDDDVVVRLPGGELTVRWPGPDRSLWMEGPATRVYEGTINT